mmetsp:Transcript_96461/g.133725  ORF Transcript_96461/g.133725 Transcript_96461/m.133725 type:complete len:121 (-) Transcript_96461:10-372(-)|eukprot:symbB.v1.2.006950.t1/scaffold416.1/size293898/9
MAFKVLSFLALCGTALAFVPPVQTSTKHQAAVAMPAVDEMPEAGSWSPLFAGASVGYAVAAVSTVLRQGRVTRKAEQTPAVARTPVAYPIFTFRWLAVHALVVPTVFFLGAISSMQFIQR